MKTIKGSDLPKKTQTAALIAFPHRFTGDHRPIWANKPRPDGSAYEVQFADDHDWLRNTEFFVTKAGNLSRVHKYCISSPTFPFRK